MSLKKRQEPRKPENEKPAPKPEKKPEPEPQPVYYIVEKKRSRKANYSAPQEIEFKK